jgi:hypothetical protein
MMVLAPMGFSFKKPRLPTETLVHFVLRRHAVGSRLM